MPKQLDLVNDVAWGYVDDPTLTFDNASAIVAISAAARSERRDIYIEPGARFASSVGFDLAANGDMWFGKPSIFGRAAGNTKFLYTGNAAAISLAGDGNAEDMFSAQVVSGIHIRGISQAGSIGLRLAHTSMLRFSDLWIDFLDRAVLGTDVEFATFRDCTMRYNTYGIYLGKKSPPDANSSPPDGITFDAVRILGNVQYGVYIVGCSHVGFLNSAIHHNGLNGSGPRWGIIVLDPCVDGGIALSVDNCYFENNEGVADVALVQTGAQPPYASTYRIENSTFSRIYAYDPTNPDPAVAALSPAIYSVLTSYAAGGGPQKLRLNGNSFKRGALYIPSSARPRLGAVGVANTLGGNLFARENTIQDASEAFTQW